MQCVLGVDVFGEMVILYFSAIALQKSRLGHTKIISLKMCALRQNSAERLAALFA